MNRASGRWERQTRRAWLSTATVAGAGLAVPGLGVAQEPQRDWSGREPIRYPDPAVQSVDKRFDRYRISSAALERLWTGMRWAEGTAWSGPGSYLMWSDIPNDRQLRLLEEDGHVSVLRHPCGNSNGNTFDYQGRQISCEHFNQRVIRYEPSGGVSVIADRWQGKPFNAPNDVVVHPDGAIWFTDPGYGALVRYEGERRPLELKEAVYRVDGATGQISKVTDELYKPNGLCFSPDYRKLYVADTGATHYPQAPKAIWVFEVDGGRLIKGRQFVSTELAGKGAGLADGIRADGDGNVWAACGWVGPGYDGIHVFAPDGNRIGIVLLPEVPANLCFGGRRRNRLFIAASQSLYALFVEAQGAHIA